MTYNITASLKEGKIVEDAFKDLYVNSVIIEATKYQNKREHWDLQIDGFKYDVKGMKKINRTDISVNENYHYIEILGITGHPGWIFGIADYFAFETIKDFIIVEKIKLHKWLIQNVIKEQVTKPTLLKRYSRPGKKDRMILVETIDLRNIAEEIKLKQNLSSL